METITVNGVASVGFVQRSEGRVAYESFGEGPLVVMVPGIGDTRAEYRFLVPLLVAAGYRAVTMDLRGLGASSVGFTDYTGAATGSDVVALLRELNAGPAYLIGTSNAAGSVAWAAAEAPEFVRAVVMIGPFARELKPTFIQRLMLGLMIEAGLRRPWGPSVWSAYYESLYPTSKPEDLEMHRAAIRSNLAEPGRLEVVREMLRAPKERVEARLGEVRAPTLVVMGTRDPDFPNPEGEARAVAERVSGSIAMIEGAGHYPHAEMPTKLAEVVLSFFKSIGQDTSWA